jgi:hypothetical protein
VKSTEHSFRLTVGEVTVTVLERTEIFHSQHQHGFVVLARKEPHAVLVEARDGDRKSVWP